MDEKEAKTFLQEMVGKVDVVFGGREGGGEGRDAGRREVDNALHWGKRELAARK